MGLLGDIGQNIGGWIEGGRNKRTAARDKKNRDKLFENLDHQPAFATDYAPTYKRSESPVARAYLESFLMGQNPNATFSGEVNSKWKKAAQQRTKDNIFGTDKALQTRSAEIQQEQPWKVPSPQRQIGGARSDLNDDGTFGRGPNGGPVKMDPLGDILIERGMPKNIKHSSGNLGAGYSEKPHAETAAKARELMQKYGSQEAAVEAIRIGREKI